MSDGKMDRQFGAAFVVLQELDRTIVGKKELSHEVQLSIYQSVYIPTLTYVHEFWLETERTVSRIQVAKMRFLQRVAGLSLRDTVKTSGGSRAAAPCRQKEPTEVVGELGSGCLQDASLGGVEGTSIWLEGPGTYMSWLGPRRSGKRMAGWMNGWQDQQIDVCTTDGQIDKWMDG